ncbi:hypothetical protein DPMN_122200 [Dreissena polymorpha]|uniref:Uncharacterized protein n=1 Tax=Dreissena polymorpha TaxID=45954 RepID=A0A9D4GRZ2_DREPO|nr:hypothetical protein DPMN_122200 [Dreissena polymorpha]
MQEIVGNMVEHIGSGFEAEIDASLDILADLVTHHLNKVAPFAILVKVQYNIDTVCHSCEGTV